MRLLLLSAFFIVGISSTAYGKGKINCNTHKIYCKIVELQPRIDKKRAMTISNLIYRKAKAHNIDPMISVAILNQENAFRDVHTYEVERDVSESCHAASCIRQVTEHHEVVDLGIAQINVRTAAHYKFDLQRLYEHDMEYAIDCHMAVLGDKMKQCKHLGNDSWSCYHSVTPKHRIKYIKMVSRYL